MGAKSGDTDPGTRAPYILSLSQNRTHTFRPMFLSANLRELKNKKPTSLCPRVLSPSRHSPARGGLVQAAPLQGPLLSLSDVLAPLRVVQGTAEHDVPEKPLGTHSPATLFLFILHLTGVVLQKIKLLHPLVRAGFSLPWAGTWP